MEFIQYNLLGNIIYEGTFTITRNPLGQKVRVTTTDDKVYIGFWGAFAMNHQLPDKIKIDRYDLDEATGKLRSFKNISDFVPAIKIVKVEAILYSNPRWGTRPTNKFIFVKPEKTDHKNPN